MKTDELVISEDYRYYVTREGKLAVLMCDLTNVSVDVPFEMLDGKDVFYFLHPDNCGKGDLAACAHYPSGKLSVLPHEHEDDIVGCLYFAGGYQEANLELQANHGRQFVCCDDSDVVGAIYNPKTGMASWYDPYMKPALSGHSLAKSIAESIARGDGKWLEATSQSLQSRREAVQRRIDEREQFPQYWTSLDSRVTYVVRTGTGQHDWHMVNADRSTWHPDVRVGSCAWSSTGRTRLTKEQAEALLDKKTSDVEWVTQGVVPFRSKIDQIRWVNHRTGEPVGGVAGQWGAVTDVVRDLYDGFVDTDDNTRLQVRCLRKDLPVKDKNIDKIAPPTNEQLFEMVANLRDQMDHLNRKVDHWMGQKE